MSLVLGWLISVGALASGRVAASDSVPRIACAPLVRSAAETPAVAADVWTTLTVHGGAVRWDLAADTPVRVWVQPRPMASVTWDDPASEWRSAVLDAVDAWSGIVPGLEFQPVRDSAEAQVVITWESSLSRPGRGDPGLGSGTVGRTHLAATDDGRAHAAHVLLAIAAPTGERYGVSEVRAVAQHEFGHALGLSHHAAAQSVMAAFIRVDRLDVGDRAALRLLYALPAGARCTRPATPPSHTRQRSALR